MFGCWIFVYSSLGILDIALVQVSGYWILGIGTLRILVIATLKTEQYSASGAKSAAVHAGITCNSTILKSNLWGVSLVCFGASPWSCLVFYAILEFSSSSLFDVVWSKNHRCLPAHLLLLLSSTLMTRPFEEMKWANSTSS